MLKYAIEVQIPRSTPLLGLLEPLLEGMVFEDVPTNLVAVKQRVEQLRQAAELEEQGTNRPLHSLRRSSSLFFVVSAFVCAWLRFFGLHKCLVLSLLSSPLISFSSPLLSFLSLSRILISSLLSFFPPPPLSPSPVIPLSFPSIVYSDKDPLPSGIP